MKDTVSCSDEKNERKKHRINNVQLLNVKLLQLIMKIMEKLKEKYFF